MRNIKERSADIPSQAAAARRERGDSDAPARIGRMAAAAASPRLAGCPAAAPLPRRRKADGIERRRLRYHGRRLQRGSAMQVLRLSKIAFVAAIALYATLVAFGNITDYGTNFAFVQHVFMMDTVFPTATTRYRAIETPLVHHIGYIAIIAAETLTAGLCWWGAFRLWRQRQAPARDFNRAKAIAIAGLTLGFLVWQVAFMSVGGEWFGMWMSSQWNGIESAFRVFITILAVLIFVTLRDAELQE
jgi:predicted small integral membrane protein